MISAIPDYFTYERRMGRDLAAMLTQFRGLDLSHSRVLDVGCGYGGVLQGLSDRFPEMQGTGIDLDPEMIAIGKSKVGSSIHLESGNFLTMPQAAFDLVCMRDVLEHIGDYGLALEKAWHCLAPAGWLYLTFAPFEGPFGGHQQNGSGIAAWTPWLHCLPSDLYLKALRVRGNSYKAKSQLDLDMQSVLATRLTERRFRESFASLPLRCEFQRRYFSRPEYRHKFGLPTIPIPQGCPFGAVFSTGIEVLAQKK